LHSNEKESFNVSFTEDKMGTWLQKANVMEEPFNVCSAKYKNSYGETLKTNLKMKNGLIDSQLCALGRNHKDACTGLFVMHLQQVKVEEFYVIAADSGSSLSRTTSKKFYIHGIVSFGASCGNLNLPGIYTKVSSYINWISDNTWNKE